MGGGWRWCAPATESLLGKRQKTGTETQNNILCPVLTPHLHPPSFPSEECFSARLCKKWRWTQSDWVWSTGQEQRTGEERDFLNLPASGHLHSTHLRLPVHSSLLAIRSCSSDENLSYSVVKLTELSKICVTATQTVTPLACGKFWKRGKSLKIKSDPRICWRCSLPSSFPFDIILVTKDKKQEIKNNKGGGKKTTTFKVWCLCLWKKKYPKASRKLKHKYVYLIDRIFLKCKKKKCFQTNIPLPLL